LFLVTQLAAGIVVIMKTILKVWSTRCCGLWRGRRKNDFTGQTQLTDAHHHTVERRQQFFV